MLIFVKDLIIGKRNIFLKELHAWLGKGSICIIKRLILSVIYTIVKLNNSFGSNHKLGIFLLIRCR